MSEDKAKQATDPIDLERQIMDSNIPKNEREWWAAREIEKLRAAVQDLAKHVWRGDWDKLKPETRDLLGEKK